MPLTIPPSRPIQGICIPSVGTTNNSMPNYVDPKQKTADGQPAYIARGGCVVTPLVNGEDTFRAVQDAIEKATISIDYLTWGFDPMMRFTADGPTIGEILLRMSATVKIRLLLWYGGPAASVAYGWSGDTGLTNDGKDDKTPNLPGYGELSGENENYPAARAWYRKVKDHPNIQIVTRALNAHDVNLMRPEVDGAPHGHDDGTIDTTRIVERWAPPIAKGDLDKPSFVQANALDKFATHHQKMVLIDYPDPKKAVGFVLGSNTLQRYWDTDDHKIKHENRRIDRVERQEVPPRANDILMTPRIVDKAVQRYLQPWQDVSAKVRGECLFDLNANFAGAWARERGGPLEPERARLKPADFRQAGGYPMQIVRTQPQDNDYSISDSYFHIVRNARRFIYIENQYFRLPELMRVIGNDSKALADAGRKKRLYVFVVTNVPDNKGRLTTYSALRVLGKQDRMPQAYADTHAGQEKLNAPLPATEGGDNAGLQTVVCTLTANEEKRCCPVYVHSKVMIISDDYLTLGSANLNRRSFVGDSELNLALPNASVPGELRRRLWSLHRRVKPAGAAKGQEPPGGYSKTPLSENIEREFKNWEKIANDNLNNFKASKKGPTFDPLDGFLTQFEDRGPVVTTAYD